MRCIACRSVQGLAAAGTWSVGNAVVADVYPIEIRGVAFGIFMMPGVSTQHTHTHTYRERERGITAGADLSRVLGLDFKMPLNRKGGPLGTSTFPERVGPACNGVVIATGVVRWW